MCCWGQSSCSAVQGRAGEQGCFKGQHIQALPPQPWDVPGCFPAGERLSTSLGRVRWTRLGCSLRPPRGKTSSLWDGGQREGPQRLIPVPRGGPSSPPRLPADSAGRDSHSFRQVLPGVNGEEVSQAPVINANYRAATWESFLPQVPFQKWLAAGVAPSFTCH